MQIKSPLYCYVQGTNVIVVPPKFPLAFLFQSKFIANGSHERNVFSTSPPTHPTKTLQQSCSGGKFDTIPELRRLSAGDLHSLQENIVLLCTFHAFLFSYKNIIDTLKTKVKDFLRQLIPTRISFQCLFIEKSLYIIYKMFFPKTIHQSSTKENIHTKIKPDHHNDYRCQTSIHRKAVKVIYINRKCK